MGKRKGVGEIAPPAPRQYNKGINFLNRAVKSLSTSKANISNQIKTTMANVKYMGNIIKKAKPGSISEKQIKDFMRAQTLLSDLKRQRSIANEYIDKIKVVKQDKDFQTLLKTGSKREINRVIESLLDSRDVFQERMSLYGGRERESYMGAGENEYVVESRAQAVERAYRNIKSGEWSVTNWSRMIRENAEPGMLSGKDLTWAYNIKQKVIRDGYLNRDMSMSEIDMLVVEKTGHTLSQIIDEMTLNGVFQGAEYDDVESIFDLIGDYLDM